MNLLSLPDIMTVHSSDSAPFATFGILSLGMERGNMGAFEIHTRYDLTPTLSAKEMYKKAKLHLLSSIVWLILLNFQLKENYQKI